jgi:hypothetical protein
MSGGRFFLDEIREQPAALRALLAAEDELEAARKIFRPGARVAASSQGRGRVDPRPSV